MWVALRGGNLPRIDREVSPSLRGAQRRSNPVFVRREAQPCNYQYLRMTADRWPGVARPLVTFLVSPRKVTKRRRPRQPRIPENRACRVGGKELAPLYLHFEGERGSNTFAADPPGRHDFRRGCKGMKVKLFFSNANAYPGTCPSYQTSNRQSVPSWDQLPKL